MEDSVKTDIALIKSDIKQINKFFGRVETSLEIVAQLQQQVAVQAETLKGTTYGDYLINRYG